MKNRKTKRRLAGGCLASLMVAAASVLAMGQDPAGSAAAVQAVLGVASVLAGAGFTLCGSAWLNRAFEEATGSTLAAYYEALYTGVQKGGGA